MPSEWMHNSSTFFVSVGSSSANHSTSMSKAYQQTSSLIDDSEVVGRVDDKSKLVDMLVHLSEEFEVERLLKEITESVGVNCDASNLDAIARTLKEMLVGKRFYLEKWDILEELLTSGIVGSKVIVTTHSNIIASTMVTNYTHRLEILPEQKCWSLFCRTAFNKGGPQETPTLSIKEAKIWNLRVDMKGIMSVLELSYDDLPSHLKRCFAYSSVFPKNYIFDKKKVDTIEAMENISRTILIHGLSCFLNEYGTITYEGKWIWQDNLWAMFVMPTRFQKVLRLNDDILMNYQGLRILDVSHCHMNKVPPSIKFLKYLRYLELSYDPIKVLPKFITSFYSLQTLKLNNWNMKKVPSSIKKIETFKMENRGLSEMPEEMGRLSNLQTLSRFIVGKGKACSIKELKHLALREKLLICGLENVTSETETREANLEEKENICDLTLMWDHYSRDHGKSGDGKMDDDVLEGLEPPHPNLKMFSIENFGSAKYPTWMESDLLKYNNLIQFKLHNCPRLEFVPTLGEQPFLRVLQFHELEMVNCLGWEFYYSSNSRTTGGDGATSSSSGKMTVAFPLLKVLRLFGMPNLVKWLEVLPSFPSLDDLVVSSCPKLKINPSQFPSLKSLHFMQTNEMALRSLLINLITLKFLRIGNCRDLKFVLERLLQNNAHVLQSLLINNCPQIETICPFFPSLEELLITGFLLVKPLPNLQGMTSILLLELTSFKGLKSQPKGLCGLTMLKRLRIGRFSKGLNYIKGEGDLQHLNKLITLRWDEWKILKQSNTTNELYIYIYCFCLNPYHTY
ncbi:hypothetical protein NE237_014514 [Protea cynaroides]|uniref:Uncharacterized protein n=1 Tax=Protea cynaroides TaxID=273540 RepID=A0A9Q0QQ70_9MAGN|nr:hypothetical protein NE237_014514 [Protea cynaroides]